MNHVNLKKSIAALKGQIKQSEKAVFNSLRFDKNNTAEFKEAIRELNINRRKANGMGASDKAWYENSFVDRLLNIGTSQLTAKNDQKALQLQLDTVAQQNSALDKQLSLQARLTNAGRGASMFGGSFVDELMNSPIKLAAIGGLVFLFFNRKKLPKFK